MQEDYVTLKFSLASPIYFKLGDYIDNELGIFEVVDLYKPTYNTTTGGYDYELRLDAYYWKWKNKKFFYTPETTGREAGWNLTATLDVHLNIFLDNLKYLGYKFRDKDFIWEIDDTVENSAKLVTYDNVNLIDALTQMAEAWGCEWWIENHKICFGRCEYSSPVDFKAGDLTDTENVNVNNMTRSDSQTTYANRIYAFGSTRNIPATYRKDLIFDVKKVNGRDISDTSRPLNIRFFPSVSHAGISPISMNIFEEGEMVGAQEEYKVMTDVFTSSMPASEYHISFNSMLLYFSTRFTSNIENFKAKLSLVYYVGEVEKVLDIQEKAFNDSVSSFTISFSDTDFFLPEKANNCKFLFTFSFSLNHPEKTVVYTIGRSGENNVKIECLSASANTSVTFLSGANSGRTFSAVYNPDLLTGEDANVIRLPEGVTASMGNQYIINNIIKGKIPDNYFSKDDKELTLNGVVQKRLMLPKDVPYIDAYRYSPTGERIYIGDSRYDNPNNVEMPEEEAIEEIVKLEDEYPKYIGSVSTITSDEKEEEDSDGNKTGNKYLIYTFKDNGLKNFTKDFVLNGQEPHLIFQTGKLAGLDFVISLKESGNSGTTFEITRNDDYGRYLPDDILYPVVSDTYILYGFDTAFISEQMLPEAEQNLLKKAKEYVKKSMIDPSTYDCEMNADFICNEGNIRTYEVGAKVNLINKAYFPEGRQSRIIGFEWPLDIPYDHPIYTVGETAPYSRIGEIESKLESLTYKGQTYSGSASGGGGTSVYVIGENDNTLPSDKNVFSAKRVLQEIISYSISKTKNDRALGLISFLKGIIVKEGIITDDVTATEVSANILEVFDKLTANNAAIAGNISSLDYAENLLGWLITPEGHIDAKSLRLRDFLEVPELRYNRVSIVSGEEWNAPGGGIIESVDVANKTVHLKLEPGEVSQVEIDDICKGVFNNDTGFQTAYFRITEKIDNASFKYVLRSGYTFNPCKAMHFVAYGNFTNEERQKSCYSTQNYIRFLKGVNNWEITKDMIAMQLGDLSNLKLFGIDMSGHSAYLNRVYMTGTIRQISSDGVTEVPVPAFKGEWKSGTYWYYDEVTHNGSTWICIESTTTQEPSDSSTDWLKAISKGDTGSQGAPGKDGIPGKDGADGKTSYFHIKYSPVQNPTASQMTDTPNKYIGTYVDFVQASSSDPSKYTWAKFEGGDGIPGTNGENGKTSYLHIKYSDDGKTFTANNGETPGIYMGVYVDFVQADSNVFADYTWSKIKGEAGKDGKGVQSVDVLYYLSSSSTSLSGGSWSTNSPTWVDGKYIWSKTKVVYTDGSSIETNPACITGGKGSTGDNGRGVSSIVEEYYLSTSSNSLVGGSWSTTPPTWENGKYIWTRSVITYTDSASTTTDPICVTGGKGATGIGVKSVSEQYYLSTSYSTTTGGSWSTTVPAWKDGKYIWTRSIITYTDNSYTETNPVCVTGGKGPSGNDGKGVKAVDVLYYLSTSSSSLVGGSWSSTSPTWQNGKYLWSKTKVTYTDNSTWESDPVCITGSQGQTGLPGAMLRPRGVWAANTEYYHNDAFIDTVIYNGQNKLCKITHTSTSSFDSTKWEEFSEFVNVATNVLLAQNATIDVLGTSGIFVGNLEKTEGWMITEGGIKHNQTGFELTPDGGINTANGQLILTANSTLIRTNTGKDIALFKEVDGVPMIDAKNINTENLVVTAGAKIGEWNVSKTGLEISGQTNANISLNISGTKFLELNRAGDALLSIRNDGGNGIRLYTGSPTSIALDITAQSGSGTAIRSAGSHIFYQRDGETWNAPGVLWAGIIDSGGNIVREWGNGAQVYCVRLGTGDYQFRTNSGHNNSFIFGNVIGDWAFVQTYGIDSDLYKVRLIHANGYLVDAWFTVMLVGKNVA